MRAFHPLRVMAFVLFAAALGACATTSMKDIPPAPIANPKTVWCDTNQPRRFTPEERAVMPIEAKREALAFNLQGADWCGWQP